MATQHKRLCSITGKMMVLHWHLQVFLGEQKPKLNRHKALEDFPQKPDAVFSFSGFRLVGSLQSIRAGIIKVAGARSHDLGFK